MPRKATKDTYGIENVGGVEVRRQYFAGDIVPAAIVVDDGDVEEVEGGETVFGADAPSPPKKRQSSKKSDG
jgi:hypothetical protein